MDNFINYEYMATLAGLIFTTNMITEFVKDMKYIKDCKTKYVSSVIAFILTLITTMAMGSFSVSCIPLLIVNSILVTFGATGAYNFNNKNGGNVNE